MFTCKFCFVIDLKTSQFVFYIMNDFEIIALFARRVHLFVWDCFKKIFFMKFIIRACIFAT